MPAPKPKKPTTPAKPAAPKKPGPKPKRKDGPITLTPQLEAARDELRALLAKHEATAFEIGQLYGRIVRERLAQKSGYLRADDFFAEHFADFDDATLRRYARVAEAFSREQVVEFKVTRLGSLLGYLKDRNAKVPPASALAALPITLANGKVKPFKSCTAKEMAAADVGAPKTKPGKGKPVVDPDSSFSADELAFRNDLRSRLQQGMGSDRMPTVELIASPDRKALPRVQFGDFSLTDFPKFLSAMDLMER